MARNQYPGICYRCGIEVPAGKGHFERAGKVWLVQHAQCAIEHRGSKTGHKEAKKAVENAKVHRWLEVGA